MKRLGKYFQGYKVRTVTAPLFKCLEACLELLVPLVVAGMIDHGIREGDSAYVLKMAGVLLLLAVIGLVCSITAQYFAARVAIHVGTGLRRDLFQKILSLGYAEIDEAGTSTLITRMTSDINQVQNGINMFLRLFMRSPFIVFGAMAMAFTVDGKAAILFAVTIPVLSIIVFSIMLCSMPLYKKVQRQLDRVVLMTRENLLGARVIRAFNRQSQEQEEFQREQDRLAAFQVFVGKISALLNPLTYIVVNLAVMGLLYTGGIRVDAGSLTQGQVVALVNYMLQILAELMKLADLIILMTKASACLSRVNAVFELESEQQKAVGLKEESNLAGDRKRQEGANAKKGFLEFDDVSFIYPGSQSASLSHLTFSAEKGQTIGIIGGTGSGKTTLINLIPRFYDVRQGEIRIDGVPIWQMDVAALRAMIGVVPQNPVLFQGTLRDNLKWGKKDAEDAKLQEAIQIAQAAEFVEQKKEGLDLRIEQNGRNLSGGQKQRLTIARALVKEPQILILDDASSALDYATDAALRKSLNEQNKERLVFLVSQRVSAVRYADQILVLEEGALAGVGTHESLLAECGVYREICQSQLGEEVSKDGR